MLSGPPEQMCLERTTEGWVGVDDKVKLSRLQVFGG